MNEHDFIEQTSSTSGVGRPLVIGSTRPFQGRTRFSRSRVFGASHEETPLFPSPFPMCETIKLDRSWKMTLKHQEIPYEADISRYYFVPSKNKPFVATRTAIEQFGKLVLVACLEKLIVEAKIRDGLNCLQIFESPDQQFLWFIDNEPCGPITAVLPDDY